MTITCRLLFSSLPARHLFCSSAPRRQQTNATCRLEKLISGLGRYLIDSPNSKQVDHHIHLKLDDILPSTPEPHAVYSKVISSLLRNRYSKAAAGVYQRMQKDGFIPSPQTHAEMLSMFLVVADQEDSQTFTTLITVVKNPLYTEDQLMQLLETMEKIRVPYELLNLISQEFLAARAPDYTLGKSFVQKLINIKTRAGHLDDALEYSHRYGTRSSASPTSPFVKILRALTEMNPSDDDALNKTLLTMQDFQVQPDINVFNVLISRELRRRSLHKAFALYRAIIKFSKVTTLSPDGSTFGILFSALYKLFKPDVHTARAPFHKSNAVIPRHLYRDMLFFRERASFPITPLLLNGALRAFLKIQDYAGAYVVLGSFRIFRLPVTAKTYDLVMQHVVRRTFWDIKAGKVRGDIRWGHRFIGLETRRAIEEAKGWTFDHAFTARVMRSAGGSEFLLSGYLLEEIFWGEHKYENPTSRMMNGRDPVPASLVLSIVPLQRILRRAMTAAEEDGKHEEAFIASRVYKAIYQAKQDIFPGKDHPYSSD